jgi:hypothetical protein
MGNTVHEPKMPLLFLEWAGKSRWDLLSMDPSKFAMKETLFVEVTHQELNQQWCRFGILMMPLAWHLRFLRMTLQAVLLCNWEVLKTGSMLADEYLYYNAENRTQSVYACLGLPRLTTDQLLLRVEFCSIKTTLFHLFIAPS